MAARSPRFLPRVRFVALVLGMVLGASGCSLSELAAPSAPTGNPATTPAEARTQLDALVIKPRGAMTGYSREKFPHWVAISGECDTRETVLQRDGQDVRVDASCRAVAGRWVSPYDGQAWTQASDVDIDHMIPLAESWRSGAARWPEAKRTEFANDLTRPQLIAVTDHVNQAKGDQAPDQWKPPAVSYWCTYSINWIVVKHHYGLSITSTEKTALLDMLSHC